MVPTALGVPRFIAAPKDLTVLDTEDATFSCQVYGRPRPEITWWRVEEDGSLTQVLEDSQNTIVIEVQEIGTREISSTLTILAYMSAGVYICRAENTEGVAEASATLSVFGE